MTDAVDFIDQAPLQDRDLLNRLSSYFDAFDQRLRQGQGWFIFNASPGRSNRIATFIQHRISEYEPTISAYMMSWRDFALSAYVNEVGLPKLTPTGEAEPDPAAKLGYEVAKYVTTETRERMMFSDLLVLTGLKPYHWHEATFLDRTIDERYRNRLATILLTPVLPTELQAEFETVDPTGTFWPRLFQRMYETSLVAL
ncbi:MAG: hypothetical protein IT336_07580 [Thermomicrobiales bacterium]|nr:hypothetical protein [Thermomicrobiales bacterium]